MYVSVCASVCVCVREGVRVSPEQRKRGGERERDGESDRERGRERATMRVNVTYRNVSKWFLVVPFECLSLSASTGIPYCGYQLAIWTHRRKGDEGLCVCVVW